jgi:5-methylcytosine-specific restriction endonuclease McrA
MNLMLSSLVLFLVLIATPGRAKDFRFFSSSQKNILWERSGGYCENPKCRVKLVPFSGRSNSFEADHIKPYSRGGKTIIKNAQALCKKCNREKSNRWKSK